MTLDRIARNEAIQARDPQGGNRRSGIDAASDQSVRRRHGWTASPG